MKNPQSPFLDLPQGLIMLCAAILAVELFFAGASAGLYGGASGLGWRAQAVQSYAFSDPLFERMLMLGEFDASVVLRFVTYPFLHSGWAHLAFPVVILLALGKNISTTFSDLRLLVIFGITSITGALVYAWVWETNLALMGAMPGAYGFVGAFTFKLWYFGRMTGQPPHQAFLLIGALCAFQLIFGLMLGFGKAWVAELAAFVAGFLIAFPLAPGGVRALHAFLRRR